MSGENERFDATVEGVAEATAAGLRAAGKSGTALLAEIQAAAANAVLGAKRTAGGVVVSGEGFLLGVMRGAREREKRTMVLIEHAASSFVRSAAGAGLDPADAALGVVAGAVAWSVERGFGAGMAIAMAEQGAIDAAEAVSAAVGRKVRAALKETGPGGAFARKEPAVPSGAR